MEENKKRGKTAAFIVLLVIEAFFLCLGIFFLVKQFPFRTLGCILWGSVFFFLYLVRPKSPLHHQPAFFPEGEIPDKKKSTLKSILFAAVCFVLILACTLPMGLSPAYNGEFPQHRNQYELLARSFLHGHIYLEYDDVDPDLEKINPYSPYERWISGVSFHSDNAYYKGKYYMYFGAVPVLMLFLPYLAITGQDFTTYHATQIFAALAILGIFLLFWQIAKKYFKNMSQIMLLSLSTAFSLICIDNSISTPALYCTATTSAVCMMVWSIYFFFTAIFVIPSEKRAKRVWLAALGSLFGALTFGCRPSAALGNTLLIPFCLGYIQSEKVEKKPAEIAKLIGRIAIIALPYVIVAIILMLYNNARFESPFEFGQAYQLTGADQSKYGTSFDNFSEVRIVNGFLNNFIGFKPVVGEFPHVYFNSAFVNFPILLMVFAHLFDPVRKKLKEKKLLLLSAFLFVTPLAITVLQICWAPGDGSAERYRMDIYYLMVLLAFLGIGFLNEIIREEKRARFGSLICILCLSVLLLTPLFNLYPCDYNYTDLRPESLQIFQQIFLIP